MADITPPVPGDRQIVQGYGDGGFRIAGSDYRGSVFVTATETAAWSIDDPSSITIDSLPGALRQGCGISVLLIGTGKTMQPPSSALRAHLRGIGIAAEVMDTGAACRTFNVLLSEDRAVAALLVAID
jgi:uncharacterized protein